jgi:hypothetical protein
LRGQAFSGDDEESKLAARSAVLLHPQDHTNEIRQSREI